MKRLKSSNFINNGVDTALAATAAQMIEEKSTITGKIELFNGSTPRHCRWESGTRWGNAYRSGRLTEWDGVQHKTL